MTRKETLHNAEVCVCGQREEDYGSPEDNFRAIAQYWEVYLRNRCVGADSDVSLVAEDVANMMTLLKIGRITTGGVKEDNYVDACGYMACAAEIATGGNADVTEVPNQAVMDALARVLCEKYESDCAKCPLGMTHNPYGIPCNNFRAQYPTQAIEIMRKEGE